MYKVRRYIHVYTLTCMRVNSKKWDFWECHVIYERYVRAGSVSMQGQSQLDIIVSVIFL